MRQKSECVRRHKAVALAGKGKRCFTVIRQKFEVHTVRAASSRQRKGNEIHAAGKRQYAGVVGSDKVCRIAGNKNGPKLCARSDLLTLRGKLCERKTVRPAGAGRHRT